MNCVVVDGGVLVNVVRLLLVNGLHGGVQVGGRSVVGRGVVGVARAWVAAQRHGGSRVHLWPLPAEVALPQKELRVAGWVGGRARYLVGVVAVLVDEHD